MIKKNITDVELIKLISQDNEKAFNLLFQKYYEKLCLTANIVFRDEHKAKDTVQEVFLDIWKRRKSLRITQSVNGYLTRAVKYKTIDYIRSQRLDFNEKIQDEGFYQNEDLELTELKTIINQTVQNLPDRCKLIFLMSRHDFLSHKEISQKLNISEKTIENQITTALKRVRKAVLQYNQRG